MDLFTKFLFYFQEPYQSPFSHRTPDPAVTRPPASSSPRGPSSTLYPNRPTTRPPPTTATTSTTAKNDRPSFHGESKSETRLLPAGADPIRTQLRVRK
jgi:hypothetical protein